MLFSKNDGRLTPTFFSILLAFAAVTAVAVAIAVVLAPDNLDAVQSPTKIRFTFNHQSGDHFSFLTITGNGGDEEIIECMDKCVRLFNDLNPGQVYSKPFHVERLQKLDAGGNPVQQYRVWLYRFPEPVTVLE